MAVRLQQYTPVDLKVLVALLPQFFDRSTDDAIRVSPQFVALPRDLRAGVAREVRENVQRVVIFHKLTLIGRDDGSGKYLRRQTRTRRVYVATTWACGRHISLASRGRMIPHTRFDYGVNG